MPDPYNSYTCIGDVCQEWQDACDQGGDLWSSSGCYCQDQNSPIIIDVAGDGITLSDAANGVQFDLKGNGTTQQLGWTLEGSDDAWLALDRNGNGVIDNGKELFGNHTDQSPPPDGMGRNGFLALEEFDKPENGGNGDGRITEEDSIFNSLRLWRDRNHNGISEPSELYTLPQLGISRIDLDFHFSRRRDENGNFFRYRAKVYGTDGNQLGRWAWDVFLIVKQ